MKKKFLLMAMLCFCLANISTLTGATKNKVIPQKDTKVVKEKNTKTKKFFKNVSEKVKEGKEKVSKSVKSPYMLDEGERAGKNRAS